MVNKGELLEQFLVDQDIFGHPITVNYRGSDTYKTRLGAFCTLATLVLVLINMGTLIVQFNDGSNQKEYIQTL